MKEEDLAGQFASSCSLKHKGETETDKLCCVCLTQEKCMAFAVCGHLCVCETCFHRLPAVEEINSIKFRNKLCPICKSPGFGIKIYQ